MTPHLPDSELLALRVEACANAPAAVLRLARVASLQGDSHV
jgi:hypothetical protein